MLVILLGAPGCGKGTQASLLRADLGYIHINVGDLFRGMKERNPAMYNVVQPIMQSGGLVPDEVTSQMVRDELSHFTSSDNIVLDGFPRSLAQAEAMKAIIVDKGISDVKVIHLDVPREILVERLLGRGRADDNEHTVSVRLSVYNVETAPVKERFADVLSVVDGTKDLYAIHEEICNKLR